MKKRINYLTNQRVESLAYQKQIHQDIFEDISNLESTLKKVFTSIPYNNYAPQEVPLGYANNIIANYEGYYASVVFTYLMSLGFPCIPEDVTNKGRIDLTIKLPKRTIIIEFKVDSKETALEQIKHKKYYEKYQNESQELFIIGVCFDRHERNITEFEWEEV